MRWRTSWMIMMMMMMMMMSWPPGKPVLAQPAPGALGYHQIDITAPQGTRPVTLLETPHMKLVTVRVPAGSRLDLHAVPEQISIQVLSGQGEVQTEHGVLKIDQTSMVVLAAGVQHAVRPLADKDLVLLVHYIRTDRPCSRGRGMGRGEGPGRGPGPAPGAVP